MREYKANRTLTITARINKRELEMLMKIMRHFNCSSLSDCIRLLIYKETDRIESGRKTAW